MGINKVEFGDSTLIDLTGDTVTADTLAQGYTAHAANGDSITGTAFLADENTVDEINSKIGTTTDTGGSATTGTVMGKLNTLLSNTGGASVIKSIQWGTASVGSTAERVTITSVNTDKSMVILNGSIVDGNMGGSVYLVGFTATQIRIGNSNSSSRDSFTASWQVIEFY
nr:MAG TPA: hypothetical protein [Caudoviricetes sp.]